MSEDPNEVSVDAGALACVRDLAVALHMALLGFRVRVENEGADESTQLMLDALDALALELLEKARELGATEGELCQDCVAELAQEQEGRQG